MKYIIDVPDSDSGICYQDGWLTRTNGYVAFNRKIDSLTPYNDDYKSVKGKGLDEIFSVLFANNVLSLPYLKADDLYSKWRERNGCINNCR